MKYKFGSITFYYLLFFILFSYGSNIFGEEQIPEGVIINKIICTQSPEHSYALYLPTEYTEDKKWPIIYALDPGARGNLPVEHFRKAAETYGFILVGSNDSRNGPWKPVFQAVIALWNDTQERFSIDLDRIYVTGFSGGSRAAAYFSRIIGKPIAVIIGCGAGLPSQLKPPEIKPAIYCGIVGRKDMTYVEMMELDHKFDEAGVNHRFFVFEGTHEWPPVDVCLRVVEWLEVTAMNMGVLSYDEELVKRVYTQEYNIAIEYENRGDLILSLSNYESLMVLFKVKIDTKNLEANIDRLKASNEYLNAVKIEQRIREEELEYMKKFQGLLNYIDQNPITSQKLEIVFANFDIPLLKKKIKNKNRQEEEMAIRLLYGLEFDARFRGWENLNKKNPKKAALFFEVAIEANNKNRERLQYLYYNLAVSYALDQNKNKAINNLKLAIENGFDNLEYIKEDESFKSIRQTSEFQKIVYKKF